MYRRSILLYLTSIKSNPSTILITTWKHTTHQLTYNTSTTSKSRQHGSTHSINPPLRHRKYPLHNLRLLQSYTRSFQSPRPNTDKHTGLYPTNNLHDSRLYPLQTSTYQPPTTMDLPLHQRWLELKYPSEMLRMRTDSSSQWAKHGSRLWCSFSSYSIFDYLGIHWSDTCCNEESWW